MTDNLKATLFTLLALLIAAMVGALLAIGGMWMAGTLGFNFESVAMQVATACGLAGEVAGSKSNTPDALILSTGQAARRLKQSWNAGSYRYADSIRKEPVLWSLICASPDKCMNHLREFPAPLCGCATDGWAQNRPSSATCEMKTKRSIKPATPSCQRTAGSQQRVGMPRRSDKFERLDHPYDTGYWLRYDGKPRPQQRKMRDGWDTCDKELRAESQKRHTE